MADPIITTPTPMDIEDLKQALRFAFATTQAFLIKAEGFHWNVTGLDFPEYHKLFGKIYDEVDEHIDEFAEVLRGIKMFVPASFQQLIDYSKVSDTVEILPKNEMVRTLYTNNLQLHEELLKAYQIAEMQVYPDIAAFLSDRIDAHRKHGWMLFSSME